MNRLEDYLREHAQSSPQRIAFQNSDGILTYSELWTAVCERASEIESETSRVYVLRSAHDFDFIIDYFAAHKAGKVVVPLEKDLPDAQFQGILELTSQADMPGDVTDILFTTGTTGKQKGTMISQGIIIYDAENLIDAQGFSSNLTFIITGPLNHIGSLSKIWPSIIVGASIYIMDGLKDLPAFFKVVKDAPWKVATFQVPASLRMMIQFGEKQLRDCSEKFDFIETGAAPISQSDMEKLCELLPHTRLYNTYASTETGIIATHNFNGGYCVAGCLGKPMKHSALTIDDDGHHGEQSLPCLGYKLVKSVDSEEGELRIVVRRVYVVGAKAAHRNDGALVVIEPCAVVERGDGGSHGFVRGVEVVLNVLVVGYLVEEVASARGAEQ